MNVYNVKTLRALIRAVIFIMKWDFGGVYPQRATISGKCKIFISQAWEACFLKGRLALCPLLRARYVTSF